MALLIRFSIFHPPAHYVFCTATEPGDSGAVKQLWERVPTEKLGKIKKTNQKNQSIDDYYTDV